MSSFYGCCGVSDSGGGGTGQDGVGIKNAVLNEKGELIFTLTNNSIINVGKVVGENGKNGITFTPHVDNNILSWTNDGGLPNPDPIDFTGQDQTFWQDLVEEQVDELTWGNVDTYQPSGTSSEYEWGYF